MKLEDMLVELIDRSCEDTKEYMHCHIGLAMAYKRMYEIMNEGIIE